MQWTAITLNFALFISILPLHAAAFGKPADASCAALKELIAFVSAETDYAELAVCPRIVSVDSRLLLSSLRFSDPENQNEALAVYLPTENTIRVSTEVDLNSPMGRSFLVHELVHALQFQSGAASSTPCLGALEEEAYRLQADFLERAGLPQASLTYRLHALVMASCGQAYHPEF